MNDDSSERGGTSHLPRAHRTPLGLLTLVSLFRFSRGYV